MEAVKRIILMSTILTIVSMNQAQATKGIFNDTHTKEEMEYIKWRLPRPGETEKEHRERLGIPDPEKTAREYLGLVDEEITKNITNTEEQYESENGEYSNVINYPPNLPREFVDELNADFSTDEYIEKVIKLGAKIDQKYIQDMKDGGVTEFNIHRLKTAWERHLRGEKIFPKHKGQVPSYVAPAAPKQAVKQAQKSFHTVEQIGRPKCYTPQESTPFYPQGMMDDSDDEEYSYEVEQERIEGLGNWTPPANVEVERVKISRSPLQKLTHGIGKVFKRLF